MSFLTPLAFLGGLIAIPILLLYMLRLRRREILVSSNFLWQQILQDREANTPWQRLRRNILLILQLIILLLLVLALTRPAQVVPTISAGKTVVLLDASASMNALDVDGDSRFEAAKDRVRQLISEMSGDDEMSIIRVAATTDPLVPYTGDVNALRGAINRAQPGSGSGDWDTALTLAAAGAAGAEDFRIIIVSDGGIGDSSRLPENIPQPVYIPVGTSDNNIAITALATRTLPGQSPQLFARVENYSTETVEVAMNIRLDGRLRESRTQTISGRSQRSFVYASVEEDFTTLEATLTHNDDVIDYLRVDDTAYTVASDVSSRRILLVSEQDNVFLEQMLRSLPGTQTFRGDSARGTLPEQTFDLYIFNGWLPQTLHDGDMLLINPPRSTALFRLADETSAPGRLQIVDSNHPVTAFLNVNSVNLRAFRPVSGAEWATPLIESGDNPVLLAGETDGNQIVLLPFDLLDSDLPLQIAFPVLMANLLDWFTPANVLLNASSLSVSDPLVIRPPVGTDGLRVTLPDGSVFTPDLDGETVSFTQTHQPGLYRLDLLTDGEVTESESFAVNLFGSGESDIAPVPVDALNTGGGEQADDSDETTGWREYWSLLAVLALGVLVYEWFVYHRRLQIPTGVTSLERSTARDH